MAFSFGNNAMASGAAGGAGGLTQGNDLKVIQTEGLGFLAIAGDAKVQLTSPWTPPPAPTASLLSIAARKGLVAAAGPDAVHIASTESVRNAFKAAKSSDSEVRPFNPQVKVPLPLRISQLAFTADEQYLILSAEAGGGLAVYEVQALTQGATQSAFELNTNGETLRALVPNPMPELGNFSAIVTNNGNLFMANLAERKLVSGPNGPALRSQVSCAAWSTKGKQLVAGMADGSVYQMTPDGTEKAHIPKPPALGDYHVSSITWLENHVFLVVHNPTNGQDKAVYHIITRHQPPGAQATFTYQKITDPVEPWMTEKTPHHTVLRLKDFPPNLQDALLVSSSATESIGLLTRSKVPLASEKPAEAITNVFTTTEFADDSKRAQLPMSEDMSETFPVGAALDLSSKDKVYKPIPSDEIELSPGPLPGLWVLNNEGVLAAWWVIYNESIRSGTTYPGLAAEDAGAAPSTSALSSAFSSPAPAAPAFGSPAPAISPFASSATPAGSAFGSPAPVASAFGGPSAMGAKASPWSTGGAATTPAFGSSTFGNKPTAAAPNFGNTPAFGSKPAATPAFGQAGTGLGNRASPWASTSPAATTPAFGQVGFSGSLSSGKVFGSTTSAAAPSSGGFAGFASKPGFGSVAGTSSGPSLFASKPATGSPFASTTPEVSMDSETAFPPSRAKESTSSFGSSPFVLGTTFKADPKTASENEKPNERSGGLFDSGFGLQLNEAAKQPVFGDSKDQDMEATTPTAAPDKSQSVFGRESTTPTTTPAPQKFDFKTTSGASSGSNIFGKPAVSTGVSNIFRSPETTDGSKPEPVSTLFGTPKVIETKPAPVSSLFGTPKVADTKPAPATSSFGNLKTSDGGSNSFGTSKQTTAEPSKPSLFSAPSGTPKIKQEDENKENLANIPEAPLPPDTTTSKTPVDRNNSPSPSPPDTVRKPAPSKVVETSASDKSPEPKSEPEPEPAPLPPMPSFTKPLQPPSNIPAPPESSEEGELSEDVNHDSDEEGEEGTDAASEGSGIDVAKDLSPTTALGGPTPGFTPQSSFGGMGGSTFSTISRSEAEPSRALFGEISRNAPVFRKPVPQSPRSPSPIRNALRTTAIRSDDTPRSFSAPGMASQILGRRPPTSQANLGFSTNNRSSRSPSVDPNVKAQRNLAAKKKAEEHVLIDPEDDGIQQILQSEIEPTLDMNEFLAVDRPLDDVESRNREEVPVACEKLWRDINRMIDRLGLNSRSLQSFILGHQTLGKEGGREREDLENPDEWVLVEAEDLNMLVQQGLAEDLEEARLNDADTVEADVQTLAQDLAKLRVKQEDMRKMIASRFDPEQVEVAKSLPLSAEQATQQNELRRAYATFSKLLAEAEEALTMLKAKIASAGGAKTQVPTVEAILRTMNKLTSMAEKRSGDIDVLENQMRRLRFGSVGLGNSPGPHSREGSPFRSVTPQKKASILSPDRMRDSFSSSFGMRGTPPRKKLSMFTDEEKQAIRQKEAKRKATLQRLRSSLERAGPNISRLKDDD